VLLRLVNRHDTDHDVVRNAVRSLVASNQQLLIATQNVAEFLNVATRPTANNGLAMKSTDATDLFLREIQSIASVLLEGDATHGEFLRLVTQFDVIGKQVHDARLVAVMLTWQVENLLTLNDRHFRRFEPEGIVIVTPADLVSGSASPP
jgi:predicted nucleic acid-binding protein